MHFIASIPVYYYSSLSLDDAGIQWRVAYEAASLSAVRAAVNAEVGITARPLIENA